MTTPQERQQALEQILAERVLVLDGAMGTMLQQRDLTADDFGGAALEGCNENLVRTRPDVVLGIHRAYFAQARIWSRPTASEARRWSWPSMVWPPMRTS